jgi:hypothetical protein
MDTATYFEMLSGQLGEIDSVTNIRLSGHDDQYGDVVPLYVADENLFLPHSYWSRLEFDVFIPFKVQERFDARCGTERFSVKIIGHYHIPVTYISGSWNDFDGSPSTAVVVVRKYLAEKMHAGEMQCGCIGPSPFHADFFTLSGAKKNKLEDLSELPGYKQYIFTYEKSKSAGLEEFIDRYGDTFALFYHLQNLRSKVIESETDVASATRQLLDNAKTRGWFARLRASMRSGALIDLVNEASLEEQLYQNFIRNEIASADEEEPKAAFDDLSYHFSELRRYGDYQPVSNVQNVVATFEKRRQGLLQNITVLIAGLAGGILGAILGSALTYSLTHPLTYVHQDAPVSAEANNKGRALSSQPATQMASNRRTTPPPDPTLIPRQNTAAHRQ